MENGNNISEKRRKMRHTVYAPEEIKSIAMRVSWVSIVVNTILSAGKLAAGLLALSGAMVSDAVHSASDVVSSVVVMLGVSFASREEDESHPYGHERLECVTALLLAALLFATGLAIGVSGLANITLALEGGLQAPGMLALWAALISIVVKEAMYWYTRHAAERINSGALLADAWHHRSDALSSIGSFVGVLGARLGMPVLDPLAALVICFFILKAAYDIAIDAFDKMVDHACDEAFINEVRELAWQTEGVLSLDDLKTRRFGNKSYVDLEIGVDSELSIVAAHQIAHELHDRIEHQLPEIKHCMIHVNPCFALPQQDGGEPQPRLPRKNTAPQSEAAEEVGKE